MKTPYRQAGDHTVRKGRGLLPVLPAGEKIPSRSKSFYRSLCDRNFDDDIKKN
jgi:hypothetical protein